MKDDLRHENSKQELYHELSFSLFAKLQGGGDAAIAERFVSALEIFERGTQLENRLREKLKLVFEQAAQGPDSFADYTERFYLRFAKETQVLLSLVDNLLRTAVATGPLSEQDNCLIEETAKCFDFPAGAYERLRAMYVENDPRYARHGEFNSGIANPKGTINGLRENAFRRLGLTSSAGVDEIRSAYRRLALLYHPDMYASVALSEEFLCDLNLKFREIKDAYELLLNSSE
jgi:DnaJ-domain-containing protein 1